MPHIENRCGKKIEGEITKSIFGLDECASLRVYSKTNLIPSDTLQTPAPQVNEHLHISRKLANIYHVDDHNSGIF